MIHTPHQVTENPKKKFAHSTLTPLREKSRSRSDSIDSHARSFSMCSCVIVCVCVCVLCFNTEPLRTDDYRIQCTSSSHIIFAHTREFGVLVGSVDNNNDDADDVSNFV